LAFILTAQAGAKNNVRKIIAVVCTTSSSSNFVPAIISFGMSSQSESALETSLAVVLPNITLRGWIQVLRTRFLFDLVCFLLSNHLYGRCTLQANEVELLAQVNKELRSLVEQKKLRHVAVRVGGLSDASRIQYVLL
jgi:hypothetical protein